MAPAERGPTEVWAEEVRGLRNEDGRVAQWPRRPPSPKLRRLKSGALQRFGLKIADEVQEVGWAEKKAALAKIGNLS